MTHGLARSTRYAHVTSTASSDGGPAGGAGTRLPDRPRGGRPARVWRGQGEGGAGRRGVVGGGGAVGRRAARFLEGPGQDGEDSTSPLGGGDDGGRAPPPAGRSGGR